MHLLQRDLLSRATQHSVVFAAAGLLRHYGARGVRATSFLAMQRHSAAVAIFWPVEQSAEQRDVRLSLVRMLFMNQSFIGIPRLWLCEAAAGRTGARQRLHGKVHLTGSSTAMCTSLGCSDTVLTGRRTGRKSITAAKIDGQSYDRHGGSDKCSADNA